MESAQTTTTIPKKEPVIQIPNPIYHKDSIKYEEEILNTLTGLITSI